MSQITIIVTDYESDEDEDSVNIHMEAFPPIPYDDDGLDSASCSPAHLVALRMLLVHEGATIIDIHKE